MARQSPYGPRDPERCDPADPVPLVVNVETDDLSIDRRIRNIVQGLLAPVDGRGEVDVGEPTEDELLLLDEVEDDLVLSPAQLEEMHELQDVAPAVGEQAESTIEQEFARLSPEDQQRAMAALVPPPE